MSSILLKITSDVSSFPVEKRFPLNIKIGDLKTKLELITGACHSTMGIKLFINDKQICDLNDDEKTLEKYLTNEDRNIRLHVNDVSLKPGEFDDLSRVKKFELDDETYEHKNESLRKFKMENRLGRFSDDAANKEKEREEKEKLEQEKAMKIKIGDRCKVHVKGQLDRKGTVMFVGTVHFKPGYWVGVKYDEPLGKNDGSIDGKRYFECANKYGSFVRPSDVEIGDFPEDIMDLDEI